MCVGCCWVGFALRPAFDLGRAVASVGLSEVYAGGTTRRWVRLVESASPGYTGTVVAYRFLWSARGSRRPNVDFFTLTSGWRGTRATYRIGPSQPSRVGDRAIIGNWVEYLDWGYICGELTCDCAILCVILWSTVCRVLLVLPACSVVVLVCVLVKQFAVCCV